MCGPIDRALPDHVATMDRLVAGPTTDQREAAAALLRTLLQSLGDQGDDIGRHHSC